MKKGEEQNTKSSELSGVQWKAKLVRMDRLGEEQGEEMSYKNQGGNEGV